MRFSETTIDIYLQLPGYKRDNKASVYKPALLLFLFEKHINDKKELLARNFQFATNNFSFVIIN